MSLNGVSSAMLLKLIETTSREQLPPQVFEQYVELMNQLQALKVQPDNMRARLQTATSGYQTNNDLPQTSKAIIKLLVIEADKYLKSYRKEELLEALSTTVNELYSHQGYVLNFSRQSAACGKIYYDLLPILEDLKNYDPIPLKAVPAPPPPPMKEFFVVETSSSPSRSAPAKEKPKNSALTLAQSSDLSDVHQQILNQKFSLKKVTAKSPPIPHVQPPSKEETPEIPAEFQQELLEKMKAVKQQLEYENNHTDPTFNSVNQNQAFKRNLSAILFEHLNQFRKIQHDIRRAEPEHNASPLFKELRSLKVGLQSVNHRQLNDETPLPRSEAERKQKQSDICQKMKGLQLNN